MQSTCVSVWIECSLFIPHFIQCKQTFVTYRWKNKEMNRIHAQCRSRGLMIDDYRMRKLGNIWKTFRGMILVTLSERKTEPVSSTCVITVWRCYVTPLLCISSQQAVTGVKPQWQKQQLLFSSDSKRKHYVNTRPAVMMVEVVCGIEDIISVCFGGDRDHILTHGRAAIMWPGEFRGEFILVSKGSVVLEAITCWAPRQNTAGRRVCQILQATCHFQMGVRLERKSNHFMVKFSTFSLVGVSLFHIIMEFGSTVLKCLLYVCIISRFFNFHEHKCIILY